MLGKIIGAVVGERVAGRNKGAKGALVGAAIGAVARRGLGPLSLALGAGYLGKKAYDRYQRRHATAPTVAKA